MKITLLGSGAREHAIAEAICKSCVEPELYCYGTTKNPGIKRLSKKYMVGNLKDEKKILEFAENSEFVVVGPEEPLTMGISDSLEREGICCIGPFKKGARLEGDKSFTRYIMEKYKTSGRVFSKVFDDVKKVKKFIDEFGKSVVVKPLGLTGGK
ncbi:MAG: phosphoribosylamine--glycine ligase, partial [Candidatus Methanofastidiosia archaeon]